MRIVDLEAISLSMRYRPELVACVQRSGLRMKKGRMALYRVELEGGAVGYGDGIGDADDVGRFVGQNALRGLSEIRHGGVQMALYDALGKALGVCRLMRLWGGRCVTRFPLLTGAVA